MAPNLQIGYLKKGLNPPSATNLIFTAPYLTVALKTGVVTGIVALAVSLLLLADRLLDITACRVQTLDLCWSLLGITGRHCGREELRHVQELPHRWQQGDDSFRNDEHCWILDIMLSHNWYVLFPRGRCGYRARLS